MKPNIHPDWHDDAVVTCACGNSFTTGASAASLQVDICSACHPFFTGEMRFVDRQGRVDRFMQKMKAAEKLKAAKQAPKAATPAKPTGPVKSYQEVLKEQQARLKSTKKNATV